jgi:putative ABC transport system permease protein
VFLAVLGATAILACASSSPALFLSSAAAGALHRATAADCPDATYPTVQVDTDTPSYQIPDDRARGAMLDAGLPEPYRVLVPQDTAAITHGRALAEVRGFYRPGATDNVTVLARGPARGLWLPSTVAGQLGVRAGQQVKLLDGPVVPVAGIYRDLWHEPVRPYWCSYAGLFSYNGVGKPPPALVLITDIDLFNTIAPALTGALTTYWVAPAEPTHLTLSAAGYLNDQQAAAYQRLGDRPPQDLAARLSGTGQLPVFAEQAGLVRDGLRGPVVPIALGGMLLALLLVGAAGSYWADRRMSEVRLLSARGVSPVGLAVKALLELALPALVGTVAGWLLARWLVHALGPSPQVDSSAPRQALLTALAALAAGLALLALVAGLRSRAATERPVGGRRPVLAAVPWEVLLLAAAAASYLALRSGPAVVLVRNIAQVKLLVVTFPLLFMLGSAILVMRVLALALPAAGGWLGRRWPAWFLAGRRIRASRLVSVLLLVAASTPIAVGLYAACLTRTAQYTLAAKARVQVGSEVEVDTVDPLRRTAQTDQAGTLVTRYLYAELAGEPAAVLAIDPDTFAGTAFWDARFADRPLRQLLGRLSTPRPDGRVPALLVPADAAARTSAGIGLGAPLDLPLGATTARLTVVDTGRLFPGRRLPVPMLVVDRRQLGQVDPHAGSRNEVWSRGGMAQAQAAVLGQDARIFGQTDVASVFDAANFVGIAWTFGYLTALAGLVGVVAIGGLLLYLETRQRSRVASYALGRRMGLTRATHLRSLLAELGTLLAAAFAVGAALAAAAILLVYHRLDVDLLRPPAPLLTVPTAVVLGALGGVAVITVLAAWYAQRGADRASVAEVLRLGS